MLRDIHAFFFFFLAYSKSNEWSVLNAQKHSKGGTSYEQSVNEYTQRLLTDLATFTIEETSIYSENTDSENTPCTSSTMNGESIKRVINFQLNQEFGSTSVSQGGD